MVGLDTTIENDWYKILAGETASNNNVQLSLSGGSQRTNFSAGANYYRESTVFPGNTDANRKALSFSLNHGSQNGKFNLQFKSAYSFNKSNLIGEDITADYLKAPYGFTLIDDKGKLVWDEATLRYGNPLAGTLRPYVGVTDMINTNLGLTFRPIESITLILNGGYNLLDYDEELQSPRASQSPEVATRGIASFGHSKTRTWSIEPQVKYDTRIATAGKISLLLGGSWQESERANVRLNGSNYSSDGLLGSITGAGTVTVTDDYSLYRYNAGFARLSFNWHQTYLLNASARRDASSRFGPGNRFANFGSIAGGWVFSNARLVADHAKWLSYGKLRVSYGTSGNDGIGNYGFLDTYTPQTNMYQQSLSLFPTRLFNPNYSWEQFRKLEAALEMGF
ncbi:SusC/RagA family TonB-linked outer membrane protein [Niabella hibiscisoli]|uniref:TonB-dependent receptor n=1 Tax=Niabella hibiscisoli TaxID=1825928 RepID=UPI001F0FA0E9|nr:TonB-dependent receptor [Niabella hibiscisoli]MCH5717843.1 TonB-dependent receptor [Niabella hibiscisoli]